jgi:uncharacterized protein (DUF1501 family)
MPPLSTTPRELATPVTTRREFISWSGKAMGLLTLAHAAATPISLLARTPLLDPSRRVLVLIQLIGGNDGLNTLIPLDDGNYQRLRPTLGIATSRILPLTEQCGFHPACRAMRDLCLAGKMTVVQNVGYAQPSRSHFRSSEIWAVGGRQRESANTGWLGRYLDQMPLDDRDHAMPPKAAYLTEETPYCLRPAAEASRSFPLLRRNEGFAASLQRIASHIGSDSSTQIYVLSLGGFDTHSHQAHAHANLLRTLSTGLQSFQQALEARGLEQQVLTMTVSEFGRSAAENEAGGTDHGTAAPLFIMGPNLQGPVLGTAPGLDLTRYQDLVHSTDFRQVYATVLEDWLGCAAADVLETTVEKLPLFQTSVAVEAG